MDTHNEPACVFGVDVKQSNLSESSNQHAITATARPNGNIRSVIRSENTLETTGTSDLRTAITAPLRRHSKSKHTKRTGDFRTITAAAQPIAMAGLPTG